MFTWLRVHEVDAVEFVKNEAKVCKWNARNNIIGITSSLGSVGCLFLEKASFLESHPQLRLAAGIGIAACGTSTLLSLAVTPKIDAYLAAGAQAQEDYAKGALPEELLAEYAQAFPDPETIAPVPSWE
ncbi:MAG TPA: hypothetical protein VHB51_03330 [Candidatus Saccharimonadales bacterium]|nr:hypothetical protein [Candidatus Saccharimonadales bacterium]